MVKKKRKVVNRRQVIWVRWIDTTSNQGWTEHPENVCPALIVTVGILAHEEEKFIRLATSHSEQCHWGEVMVIPKYLIFERRVIATLEEWSGANL